MDLNIATTTPYDVADHLRTPEEMAVYLEACIEEANGDADFISKARKDIARAKLLSRAVAASRPGVLAD